MLPFINSVQEFTVASTTPSPKFFGGGAFFLNRINYVDAVVRYKKIIKGKYMLKTSVLLLMLISSVFGAAGVTFVEESKITNEGLYFWYPDGKKANIYGRSISPHGDCYSVANGYIYFGWYKGGMSDRTLMLSRKKIGSTKWVHVALPHKNTLIVDPKNKTGPKIYGNTHQTVAVEVSKKDSTIHILYDHHADRLKYIVSKKGSAFVSDAQFKIGIFNKTRDYFASGEKILRVTYPELNVNNKGEVIVNYREGTSHGGNEFVHAYNGNVWTKSKMVIQGYKSPVKPADQNYAYGKTVYSNGSFYYIWSVRWDNKGARLNEGVYFAKCGQTMTGAWEDINGKKHSLPIRDYKPFLIDMPPTRDNEGSGGGTTGAVTENGDIHLGFHKGEYAVTYTRKKGEKSFTKHKGMNKVGTAWNNRFYITTVENDGTIKIESTTPGTIDFKTEITHKTGVKFGNKISKLYEGYILVIAEKMAQSDKHEIYSYVFKLPTNESTPEVDYTPPAGFVFAANGQDTVKINDGKTYDIAFGANGTFEYLREHTSDVYCYPTSFAKDPLPGIVKKCFIKELPNVAPVVSFNTPTTANVTITQGDAFYVDANIKDENISYAELFIDGVLLRKESVAPYQWGNFEGANNANELDTLAAGSYTIKVVATDKEGLTGEASFTLNVQAEAPTILHSVDKVSNLNILAGAGGFRVTTGASPAELKVTNIQGQVVFSESGVFTNYFVPMKANGVYFIDIVQGDKRFSQKYVAVHN